MKISLSNSSISGGILRFSLLLLLLIIGNGGIFSEESNNPVSMLKQVPHETHAFVVNAGGGDFCIFMPGTYFHANNVFYGRANRNRVSLKNLNIMGTGKSNPSMMAEFLETNNPKISRTKALKIAHLYVKEANKAGVNYDLAFSQMCLETGFLRYGGKVRPQQNNFCGLGVTGRMHGLSFPSVKIGIRAHIQHLKAYATTANLKKPVVDSRLRFVKRGSVKTLAGLSGKWAADKHYSEKILSLLTRLYGENRN